MLCLIRCSSASYTCTQLIALNSQNCFTNHLQPNVQQSSAQWPCVVSQACLENAGQVNSQFLRFVGQIWALSFLASGIQDLHSESELARLGLPFSVVTESSR